MSRAQTPRPALREKVSTMPQLERQKEERKDSLELIRRSFSSAKSSQHAHRCWVLVLEGGAICRNQVSAEIRSY